MAQLRQDHPEFRKRNIQVVVIGPDNQKEFKKFWAENDLPFIGIPDPKAVTLSALGQEIKIHKWGRMPAQIFIDQKGRARYIHYGDSMSDIPESDEIFAIVDGRIVKG